MGDNSEANSLSDDSFALPVSSTSWDAPALDLPSLRPSLSAENNNDPMRKLWTLLTQLFTSYIAAGGILGPSLTDTPTTLATAEAIANGGPATGSSPNVALPAAVNTRPAPVATNPVSPSVLPSNPSPAVAPSQPASPPMNGYVASLLSNIKPSADGSYQAIGNGMNVWFNAKKGTWGNDVSGPSLYQSPELITTKTGQLPPDISPVGTPANGSSMTIRYVWHSASSDGQKGYWMKWQLAGDTSVLNQKVTGSPEVAAWEAFKGGELGGIEITYVPDANGKWAIGAVAAVDQSLNKVRIA